MPTDLRTADVIIGAAGPAGGGVTNSQLTAAIAGLAPSNAGYITRVPEAGLSNETALSTLATGLVKVTTGTGVLSTATGSDLPPHNHAGVVTSVSIPIDGGGAAITSGTKYLDIYVPVAMTITGWVMGASASGTLQLTVLRALAASPTSYSAISGTEKPLLSSQQTNSDLALSTWTTSLAAGDRLRIDVDASPTPTAILATLTLLFTRSI